MGDRSEDWRNAPHQRNPLADLWRLCEVERWQIVRTTKNQNVAEHTFIVTLLALKLADATGVMRDQVMQAALFHDAEEAWTGDIPSPMKQFINKDNVPKRAMLGEMAWLDYKEGVDSPIIGMLIKIADLASDIKFLSKYGEGAHAMGVEEEIRVRLVNYIGLAKETAPTLNWTAIELELDDFWHGKETYLDDYITKTT